MVGLQGNSKQEGRTLKIYPFDVTFFCSGMPMSGESIPSGKSVGGSETCAIQMAQTLAKKGHRPIIFCNTEQPHARDGVTYIPIGWVQQPNGGAFPKGFLDYARSTPHDLMIIMRMPGVMSWEFKSKVNLLWQHDLATKTGPSNFHPTCWNTDRILMISEFMKRQYKQVHGGPDELYHVTRNGIDLEMIDAVLEQERDRYKIMFTARPERGLDIMLREVFPRILTKEPKARLYISRYDDVATLPLYEECSRMAAQFGDRIVNLGNLGKQELYKHYKQARVFAYSSVFEEVSMLTYPEFTACGGVFVGPWKAALPETAGDTGVLIRDDGSIGKAGDNLDDGFCPVSVKFCDRMADEVVDLIRNDERWERLSKAGRKRAETRTWDAVADDWIGLTHQLIEQRTSDPKRVLKHFLVNSDVVAAQKYAEKMGEEKLKKSVQKYIDRFVPFMNAPEAKQKSEIAKFYEERSGGDGANWQTAFYADREPRLQILRDWIAQHKGEVGSVLDFGCAHGGYARALTNSLTSLRVLGVDVSPSLIRCAKELKNGKMPDGNQACAHPENLSFVIGDEDTDILDAYDGLKEGIESPRQFDLVVAMEILEHLPNAEEVAKKLERHCKPGGWMCFTVPHGHRERDEFLTKGVSPVHVRSFDRHDLIDLFGHREGFQIVAFSDFAELDFDRTFAGWFMVFYKNDGKEIGQIDWERKFFLQGPRETVSVCMITNNAESTLHRTIKSVQKIADQVIVVDNGPSVDSTKVIAKMYTDEVRDGTSPFWCYVHKARHHPMEIVPGVCDPAGFETPRNESVQGAWGDWIFWIDSDEQLLNWQQVWQYLRPNSYLGYAVNQHHLSVDPPGSLRKDIPVRLFRNHRGMRFYGCMTPKTKVVTNPGLEEIQDVKVGTLVRTHDGTYRPVSKIWEYEVRDEMVRVLARGMPEPLELTRDHKIYAIRHEQCFYNYGKHYLCKPTCGKRCPHKFYEHYAPDWVMAKDLKIGDILMYPVEKTMINVERIKLSDHAKEGRLIGSGSPLSWKLVDDKWVRKNKSQTAIVNDEIELSGAFLRLCGYYVSDGCIAEGAKLIISFAEYEQSYADDVSQIAKTLGFNYSEIHKYQMITAKVYGRPICEWLKAEFGSGARAKKAPLWVMRLPVEKQKEFLRGLWRGDGNVSGTLVRYTTAHNMLAHQIQDLLLRQQIMANIRYGKASKCYEVFARLQAAEFLDWTTPATGRMRSRQTWTDGDYVYMPIRDINRFEYEGPIFDLTVEGNHSFIANRAAVSNCVHEHAELAINAGVGSHVVALPIDIHHDGYLTEPIRRGRFHRNIRLLECDRLKYPDRLLGIYLYDVRDNIHLARYEMERNGGRLTEQGAEHCRRAINAFRQNFLGKEIMLAQDGMGYYSDALAMLGLGIEIALDIDVKPQGAHLNGGGQRFRVMDQSEAKIVTEQILRQKFGPFEGRYIA